MSVNIVIPPLKGSYVIICSIALFLQQWNIWLKALPDATSSSSSQIISAESKPGQPGENVTIEPGLHGISYRLQAKKCDI